MRTLLLTIIMMLVCTVSANTAELKVKVPVSEFEQMKSQLADLENENNRLKQEVRTLEQSAGPSPDQPSQELKSRLSDLENENSQLESENSQLKQQVTTLESSKQASQPAPAPDNAEMQAQITKLENKNRRLRSQVKNLKESGIAAVLAEDRRTARQVYAVEARRNLIPPFKF